MKELREKSGIENGSDKENYETASMQGALAPADDGQEGYDYKGWENLPALYLKIATQYPIFNDMIKA